MSNHEIAKTILSQLGGNKFIAMTGANSFSYGVKCLTFRIGRNARKVKAVRITLDASDTYTMEFLNIHGLKVNTVSKWSDVYADNLQNIFKIETGLATYL